MTKGQAKRKRQLREKVRRKRKDVRHSVVMRGSIEKNECILDLKVAHPKHPLNARKIKAVIDTGATACTVRADVADALGLPVIGTSLCWTPHGEKESPVVLVMMRVGKGKNEAIKTVTASVMEEQRDEMLFGMDAMKGGVLTVDTLKERWEWKLKPLD